MDSISPAWKAGYQAGYAGKVFTTTLKGAEKCAWLRGYRFGEKVRKAEEKKA